MLQVYQNRFQCNTEILPSWAKGRPFYITSTYALDLIRVVRSEYRTDQSWESPPHNGPSGSTDKQSKQKEPNGPRLIIHRPHSQYLQDWCMSSGTKRTKGGRNELTFDGDVYRLG